MTKFSINLNKFALLRNSRGRDLPNLVSIAKRCVARGVHGLTLHPRPDQRHARYEDVRELKTLCVERGAELNVEGFPTPEFLTVVLENRPDQCTLVPDAPGQITSDHGWRIQENEGFLREVLGLLRVAGIRSSIFIDHDSTEMDLAGAVGADRVELYTEPYALAHDSGDAGHLAAVLRSFQEAAGKARAAGLGVNAGHDLNLRNLREFLAATRVEEVSIGHALIVESLESGVENVVSRYLEAIRQAYAP